MTSKRFVNGLRAGKAKKPDARRSPEIVTASTIDNIAFLSEYARRITLLIAKNNREAAFKLLEDAFDFRDSVLKDTFNHKGDSIEAVLPVDIRYCRRLRRNGFDSMYDMRGVTLKELRALEIPPAVCRDILAAVNEWDSFSSRE